MRECTLDCLSIANPEEFHDVLVEALALPNWYGTNLDALYDCLTSITEETPTRRIPSTGSMESADTFGRITR